MVASREFAEFLEEQLAPVGAIGARRMFGTTGIFCDGLLIGLVSDNTLYLRVDDQNRDAFREAQAFPPLSYRKGGKTLDLPFWRAPDRLFDEPEALAAWGREALGAALRVAARRKPRARRL